MTKSQIIRWMRAELSDDPSSYLDCGEVDCTSLGEAYADANGVGEEIPDDVWDAAFEVAEWWTEQSA